MPDLAWEIEQLQLADAHIATAEHALVVVGLELARKLALGDDTSTTEETQRVMREGLAAFQKHRELIADTIEGIRKGELPG